MTSVSLFAKGPELAHLAFSHPTWSIHVVAGMPAEAKARTTRSFRAWCIDVLPGARLQTKLWRPRASTADPQRHWCGTHKFRPSCRPTATLTASSSSLRPQEVMRSANNQSPVCGAKDTRNEARSNGELRLDSTKFVIIIIITIISNLNQHFSSTIILGVNRS